LEALYNSDILKTLPYQVFGKVDQEPLSLTSL